jgi:hypothetical protein
VEKMGKKWGKMGKWEKIVKYKIQYLPRKPQRKREKKREGMVFNFFSVTAQKTQENKKKRKRKRKRMAEKKIQYLPRKPEKDKRKGKENGQLKTFCNCPGWDMSIESNSQP